MGVKNVLWAQTDPGRLEMREQVVEAQPLLLASRGFTVGFTCEIELRPQTSLVGITADRQTQARWFGAPVDSTSIAASRAAIDLSTSGSASFYSISVDENALVRHCGDTPDALALLEEIVEFRFANDPLFARRIRATLERLFSMQAEFNGELLPHGIPTERISGTLVPLLASALERHDSRAVEPSKCLNRRLTAVRRCERHMRDHADANLTLLDLSRISGMRSRTLINAFEAVTGFSPMDYLKRLRLDGVRRALGRADRDCTRIIDVATEWGFWHMGHFAADYRAMFGETPSETLLR